MAFRVTVLLLSWTLNIIFQNPPDLLIFIHIIDIKVAFRSLLYIKSDDNSRVLIRECKLALQVMLSSNVTIKSSLVFTCSTRFIQQLKDGLVTEPKGLSLKLTCQILQIKVEVMLHSDLIDDHSKLLAIRTESQVFDCVFIIDK